MSLDGSGPTVVGSQYILTEKIGEGSFGLVFRATNTATGDAVAVKLEPLTAKSPQLEREFRKLQLLRSLECVPQVYWFGETVHNGIQYRAMVMELLGPNMLDLMQNARRLSLKTVLMLADQLLAILEQIHKLNVLHRDVKPENIVVGLKPHENKIRLIDFGLCGSYMDRHGNHVELRQGCGLIGTARYVSVNTHLGVAQSRRDDLECLCYVLILMLRGKLPWQKATGATKQERQQAILEMKSTLSAEEICQGCPGEFVKFLKFSRALGFNEEPDYSAVRQLFRTLYANKGLTSDGMFDWMGGTPSINVTVVPPPTAVHELKPPEAPRLGASSMNLGVQLSRFLSHSSMAADARSAVDDTPVSSAVAGSLFVCVPTGGAPPGPATARSVVSGGDREGSPEGPVAGPAPHTESGPAAAPVPRPFVPEPKPEPKWCSTTVFVIEARDLAAADFFGSSDPYAVLRPAIGGAVLKTPYIKRTLHPRWNATFTFLEMCDTLEVEVWDKDMFKDDFLGHVEVPLSSDAYPLGRPVDAWYELQGRGKAKETISGSIRLVITRETSLTQHYRVLRLGMDKYNIMRALLDTTVLHPPEHSDGR